MYKKESLERLKDKVDLVELVSGYLQMQRTGGSYKACCPFHNEKTPSFVIQKGENHYHCFGCGAHGDAISFMMMHLKMNFAEAVEVLAERFQIVLEKSDQLEERRGPSKAALKEALEKACSFFHFCLMHTDEGHIALDYIYERGLVLDFIQKFRIGYAPSEGQLLQKFLAQEGIKEEVMEQAGLLLNTQSGRKRDFFSDRITFPIFDGMGSVIGFSARKFKETTYGGKYINTSETPLFKKSQILYGLNYSRQRIAKERQAIIVEGQIDALRLIYAGFDYTVAGQGTAFGEGHVKELLHLGINHVFLALDGDEAGEAAAVKIGNLFQKKGVEVAVAYLPAGIDPDLLLRERGPGAFQAALDASRDYLTFLFEHHSKTLKLDSPSQKSELVRTIADRIREWDQPVMVHESLRKLALIAKVPENVLDIGTLPETPLIKQVGRVNFTGINPDRILETDLLRWLLLVGQSDTRLLEIVRSNLKPEHFRTESCRHLFSLYLEQPRDLFSLAIDIEGEDGQALLSEIMEKKINLQKAEEGVLLTVRKILLREWMAEREAIKMKIHQGDCSDEEVLELAKQFDLLKKQPPELILPV